MEVARGQTSSQGDETQQEALSGDRGGVAVVRIAAADFTHRRSLVGALVALVPAQDVTQLVTGASDNSGKRHLGTIIDVGSAACFRIAATNTAVALSLSRHRGRQADEGENGQHDSVHF